MGKWLGLEEPLMCISGFLRRKGDLVWSVCLFGHVKIKLSKEISTIKIIAWRVMEIWNKSFYYWRRIQHAVNEVVSIQEWCTLSDYLQWQHNLDRRESFCPLQLSLTISFSIQSHWHLTSSSEKTILKHNICTKVERACACFDSIFDHHITHSITIKVNLQPAVIYTVEFIKLRGRGKVVKDREQRRIILKLF